MSGGVDSSVSAALLKQGGFDVTGVYMKQWSPKVLGRECIWKQERQDALRVARQLGIKFLTWDFSKEYEKEVGKYMIDSYKKGITPNPDVMCNKVIKFGLFFDKAMKQGADFVATGHYAQTPCSLGSDLPLTLARQRGLAHSRQFFASPVGSSAFAESEAASSGSANHAKLPCEARSRFTASLAPPSKSLLPRLLKARDKNKDQTYFLWTLKQKHLAKTLFHVGGLTKPEVRKLAKKFRLHVAEKKDSQGVCFIGPLDMKNFLKSYIKPKKGKILSLDGKFIGHHDGAYYYTVGQRHGLWLKGSASTKGSGETKPYFVVKKDVKKNIIYVGKEKDLYAKSAKIKNINWILKPKKFPASVQARMRYRAPLAKAKIYKNGKLIFLKPHKAIAPGQSAVFYKGQQVIGGGIID